MVIQRSWKILSDAASTTNNNNNNSTAGGELQQRSPAALQANSSSDDSDCSNQTTHSMDTRVASPIKQEVTASVAGDGAQALQLNGTESGVVSRSDELSQSGI